MDREEYKFKLMQWYSDSAKSYTQISAAALLLPVFLVRQVVGVAQSEPMNLKWPLYASWLSFLLSIIAGLLYQYFAIKYVQAETEKEHGASFVLVRRPRYVYGAMLVAFFSGAVFFVWGAGMQLNWFLNK